MLAAAVRFLEFSEPAIYDGAPAVSGGHPVLYIMQQAHPVLATVLESPQWCTHAAVVDASCEVYQKTLLCVKVRPPLCCAPLLQYVLCDTFAPSSWSMEVMIGCGLPP